jgi:guanylate kinase
MHVAIDFDLTIVDSKYPEINELLPNAKEVINYIYDRGHTIIINTCRANHYAENAKAYLDQMGVRYDFFNENDPKLIEKYGTDTRKISADVYIDDKVLNDVVLKKMIGAENYNDELWQTSLEQFAFIERPCIICIVGESGTGKSISAEYFRNRFDINLIESYTDRPKRTPDESGHIFLTQTEFTNLQGEVLAHTKFGNFRYCCLVNDLEKINTYVIDENGLEQLKNNWSDVFDIYSIRIKRGIFDRLESVSKERIDRDEGKFTMKDVEFDFVINNDENQKEKLYGKLEEFMSIFRLKERALDFIPYPMMQGVNDL